MIIRKRYHTIGQGTEQEIFELYGGGDGLLLDTDRSPDSTKNSDGETAPPDLMPGLQSDGTCVYMIAKSELSKQAVKEILRNPDVTLISKHRPLRPIEGTVYVYHHTGTVQEDDRQWRSDGYNWARKTGQRHQVVENKIPVLYKQKWNIYAANTMDRGNPGFMRYEWELFDSNGYALVHYVGNHKLFEPRPHGNALHSPAKRREYFESGPEVRQFIDQREGVPAIEIYNQKLADTTVPAHLQPTAVPRNKKQVWNALYNKRNRFRLTHDGTFNAFYVSQHLDDFVRRVVFTPKEGSLFACLFKEDIARFVDEILRQPAKHLLAYDTTFGFGSHWVSILSIRMTIFDGNPLLPIAFFVHERRYIRDHEYFLRLVADICPALKTTSFSIVTDREFKNLSKIFPSALHVHCWNHIQQNVRRFLAKHKATCPAEYSLNIVDLLNSQSRQHFDASVSQLTKTWHPTFHTYFEKKLKSDIANHAGKWIVKETGYCSNRTGITSNMAESVNKVLQDMKQSWKGAPLDGVICGLHYITACYLQNIERGRCNMGDYYLKPQFRSSFGKSYQEFRPPKDTLDLNGIVPRLLDHIASNPETFWPLPERPSNEGEEEEAAAGEESNDIDEDEDDDGLTPEEAEARNIVGEESSINEEEKLAKLDQLLQENSQEARIAEDKQHRSIMILAKDAFSSNKVHRVPTLDKCYVVEDSGGRLQVVRLAPLSCSCKPTLTCHHIKAVRFAAGDPEESKAKNGKPNVSILRGNYRKPCDKKKIGKKTGDRPVDVDPVFATVTSSQAVLHESEAAYAPPVEDFDDHGVYANQFEVPDEDIDARPGKKVAPEKCGWNSLVDQLPKVGPAGRHGQTCVTDELSSTAGLEEPVSAMPSAKGRTCQTDADSVGPKRATGNHLETWCFCKRDLGAPYVQCSNGNRCSGANKGWYHTQCVDVPSKALTDRRTKWLCPSCSLPDLLTWNDPTNEVPLKNTCPVDGVLSLFGLQFTGNSQLIDCLRSSVPAENALRKAMTQFVAGRPNQARRTWANFLLQQRNVTPTSRTVMNENEVNLYGSEENRFFKWFKSIYTAQSQSRCDAPNCPSPLIQCTYEDMVLNEDQSLEELFADFWSTCNKPLVLAARTQKRFANRCKGLRTTAPRNFCTDKPWFFPLSVQSCSVKKVMGLPEIFSVQKLRFRFGGFTVYEKDRDHFTLFFLWQRRWFHYDGMRGECIVPAEQVEFSSMKPNFAVFFMAK